jgi:integrase
VIHSVLSGALTRAVKWRWIAVKPALAAGKPAAPTPGPQAPNLTEAARILTAAWADLDWGMLVRLAMVIGARRGELCGLRWRHVDLVAGVLTVRQSQGQLAGRQWEKDTRTHQTRRVALDPETVQLLAEHRDRCAARAGPRRRTRRRRLRVLRPDGSTPLRPDSVTQRYGRLAKRLGIKTHLHALRHTPPPSSSPPVSTPAPLRAVSATAAAAPPRGGSTPHGSPKPTSAPQRAACVAYRTRQHRERLGLRRWAANTRIRKCR